MKLKKVELDGFGKLVNCNFEFGPGFNLIFGRNEAGKSTLQRSILAALYGFFDDGTITAQKRAALTAFEPWNAQARFGLKLSFEVDKGNQYQVLRVFMPKADTILYDLKNRKNVSDQFQSTTHGRLYFSEELLGMPRDVFENTCLVRQAELAALEKSASAITDSLLRLSASGSQESTANQAIELLNTTLREQVGTTRSRNKPLPEAIRHLETLKESRVHLQNEHKILANQMHELSQAEDNFAKMQNECSKAEYQRLLAQRMVVQLQKQSIEQTDAEVERCKTDMTRFQKWSEFPIDTQPQVQRLIAQREKVQDDARKAKQTSIWAIKKVPALSRQIEALFKSLEITDALIDPPDLEKLLPENIGSVFQDWSEIQFSKLRESIRNREQNAETKTENQIILTQIGHEGIAKFRQELGMLEHDKTQAEQAVEQIQDNASQSGLPEEHWQIFLSNAQAEVTKWQDWSNFPADLRDELLKLTAQYTPLRDKWDTEMQGASESEKELVDLQKQIEALREKISDHENIRTIPHQEKSRIKEIVSQLNQSKMVTAKMQQQFDEIDKKFQGEQSILAKEEKSIASIASLGLLGITTFQQRWLNMKQQLKLAQGRFLQAQEAWNKVGMSASEFEQLESRVADINNGVGPAPKQRSGCAAVFISKLTSLFTIEEESAPSTEITIYSQIKPIEAEFTRCRSDVAAIEDSLKQVENEIHNKLGISAPDVIDEGTFDNLLGQLQDYQQKNVGLEQLKSTWSSRNDQFQQAKNRAVELEERLIKELQSYGFSGANVEEAVNQYLAACDQKENLLADESSLEPMVGRSKVLKQQVDHNHTQKDLLTEIEASIINLLAKAQIKAESAHLQDDIQQYEQGLKNHTKWKQAQYQFEQLQKQISDYEEQLSKGCSLLSTQHEKLLNYRKSLINKFSGQLPDDFTDQDLSKLDLDLQAHLSAQSEIDKAQGILEQQVLQAQTIYRDLNDWAEQESDVKDSEVEILKIIQSIGIQTDQLTLIDALKKYDEAFQGFTNWQQAQQSYNSAIQSQQAVRKSLSKLEGDLKNVETKISESAKQQPEWKNLTVSDKPEVYEHTVQKLNDQILQERDRLTRLQDAVSRGAKSIRHLAELEEEIDMMNAEVRQITDWGQALDLAIKELTDATYEFQKMFAPRLEQIVEGGLNQITSGRYHQVKIDPNSLGVNVLAPERKELVPTEFLSTGTRDLIYLVLRMGIAQMMSSSGEKLPLLLDDPLVEFDRPRQLSTLDFLKNISNQTQVLFFTKDMDIVNWFKNSENLTGQDQLIELN